MSNTGFFGGSNSTVNPTTSGGLFGPKPTPSLNFGSQPAPATTSLFSNNSQSAPAPSALNFNLSSANNAQPMQQQMGQQHGSLYGQQPQLMPTLQPQPIQSSQMSSSSKQEVKPTPAWFTDNVKRSTPQTVVRRSNKGLNDDEESFPNSSASIINKDPFGTVSFGTKKSSTHGGKNSTLNSASVSVSNGSGAINSSSNMHTDVVGGLNKNNLNFQVNSADAPPTKSIFDIQREDEFGNFHVDNATDETNHMSNNDLAEDNVKSNVPVFKSRNIFDKSNNDEYVFNANSKKVNEHIDSKTPQGYAVLVFGYPESISNQVIAHFGKFGKILEDFEVCRAEPTMGLFRLNNNNEPSLDKTKFPIFTGNGWVKITYTSESSASRALKENGTVYGGVLVGCVPYSKEAVEGLANCKIEKYQDSLSVASPVMSPDLHGRNTNATTASPSPETPISSSSGKNSQPVYSKDPLFANGKKLEIQKDTNIFVHNNSGSLYNADGSDKILKHGGWYNSLESSMTKDLESSKKPQGVVGNITNWLFGWGEL